MKRLPLMLCFFSRFYNHNHISLNKCYIVKGNNDVARERSSLAPWQEPVRMTTEDWLLAKGVSMSTNFLISSSIHSSLIE